MRVETDAELVIRARRGDRAAFDALVVRHRRALTAAALHLVGDLERAEDAVQEALATAYERLTDLRDPSRFRQWVHTVVHRLCIRNPWGSRRVALYETPPDIPSDAEPLPESANAVIRAINELPQCYRELLAARYLAELDYRELADLFGVAEGAVRVRVFRAKKRLAAVLASAAREEQEVTGYGMP